ncbi:NADPH-dependent FMN reductase [Candidatus Protochlamydia phocaeensis]|uniref:NADPH-dependent FMN reductase n=1 Tax=Candidatus Protochlamydia phocaeensis TaxID=1414722 RepID=UPI000838C189|nr:NADPH-dependent FMN reductase [Candidatus Protochlamydia phocaeensis]
MKIIAIGGSLRPHSYTYQILNLALKEIPDKDIQTQLIDLRQLNLPFCQGGNDYPAFPDVEKFRQTVRSSSGILLATPEYHGSVSGVLKNALDLLDEEHLAGKVVGLIAVVGGVHSTNAINTLRLICRQLHCWVLPEQIVIPHAETSFNAEGELTDLHLQERLSKMVQHLIEFSKKIKG